MTVGRSSIVLIGMPGSGKSTVGVLLAKAAGLGFVDTDLLIQQEAGRPLQAIVDRAGYRALRELEERVLWDLEAYRQVIATGGSAVYSEAAMNHLKAHGVLVFLDISLATMAARIGDFSLRGLSKHPDQTLEDLYRERLDLYRRYAEITVRAEGRDQDQVCQAVLEAVTAQAPNILTP